ncbi:MAG TPA: PHP domain-containing protein [Marmoricola sp.]|nr:PHP domain-containing protein [Marmoricola sp.]
MRIDLHTHSSRSDGTEAPRALVFAARDAGLDVVAITDHDTTAGWDEAAAAAEEVGLELVRGMELSTRHAGRSVHLLAYLTDPADADLLAETERVVAGRRDRVPALVEKLVAAGIELTAADIEEATPPGAVTGRPHVADALVARGVVASRDEAFATVLGPNGPGFVRRYATPLTEAIGLVARAGGVSVIAHPWARSSREVLDAATIAELRDLGLGGLEVDHQDHDERVRARLRELADELDLVATGSSDWHGAGKAGHDLGCNTTEPEQYHRLLAAARAAAATAARADSTSGEARR